MMTRSTHKKHFAHEPLHDSTAAVAPRPRAPPYTVGALRLARPMPLQWGPQKGRGLQRAAAWARTAFSDTPVMASSIHPPPHHHTPTHPHTAHPTHPQGSMSSATATASWAWAESLPPFVRQKGWRAKSYNKGGQLLATLYHCSLFDVPSAFWREKRGMEKEGRRREKKKRCWHPGDKSRLWPPGNKW